MAEVIDVLSDGEDDITASPADPQTGGWACPACTLLNKTRFLACEACGGQRPSPRGPRGAAENGDAAVQPDAGQQAARAPGGRWTCRSCTFNNSCSVAECEMCAAPGAGAAALAAADPDAPGPSWHAQPPAVLGPTTATWDAVAVPDLAGLYTLDCGCRLPGAELQQHLGALAGAMPSGLPALNGHFRCLQQRCQQALTHRDLGALLGADAAGKVNAHVWAAAAAESTTAAVATAPQHQPADDGLDDLIDLVGSPEAAAAAAQALCAAKQPAGAAAAATATAKHSAQQAVQQCSELAVLLRQLHGALVDGKLPAQAADDRSKDGSRLQGGSSGSSKAANGQQHREGVGPKQETGRQGTMDEGAPAAGSDRRRGRSARQQSNPEGPPAKRTKTWQQQNPAPWAGKKGGPAAGTGYGGTGGEDGEYGAGYGAVAAMRTTGTLDDMVGPMLVGLMGSGYGGSHGGGAQANRPQGVGYGGVGMDGRSGSEQARRQQADAARRQQELDEAAAGLLKQLSQRLQSWSDEAHECLAPLPLLLLAALRGGPLAPLLRLLLQNDSLMDVSGRRELYKEVFGLVAVLAGSPDLLPLLLQPADSDLLKGCFPQQAQQARQVQQSPGRPGSAAAAAAGKLGKRPTRGKGRASPAPAAAEPEADGNKAEAGAEGPPAGDTSCLGALQALRLQADIFRHNAEELAAEGDEEDLQLVGAILDVSECCQRVQQAVELWQASTGQGSAVADQEGDAAEPQAQQRQQQHAADSPELRQQYVSSLKPLLFQSLPLMQDHYYRQHAATKGGLSDRLRRITKEVSTLPGQLPLGWESAVLAAMDEDNMGVLRAVILAPHDTPYACGAFAFDILLPPDYPNQPPQVHFLTTGGGRVRFNPNLYNNGKVCLSLLGTWAGPSWQPGQSTLLQVLVSMQSMILGTQDPYFNEPGYASMEGTQQGRGASQQYNRDIRRHTLQVAILAQLQRPPAGFEEAVRLHFRLKAGVIKEQVRQWAREDSSLKHLAAQVVTALDAAADSDE